MSGNESGAVALRKGFSYVDLSAGIAQMYQNPAENVIPNVITSEKQAVKEIKEIVTKFKESNEWDEKMALCQQLMSDIKGGACNFPLFVQDIPTLVPMLSHCVQNLRSTLVKFGCLCIVQIAQVLQEKFDPTASTILGSLFPPTTHATAIISCSCKCAIEAIVKNCPGRFVLNTIIANASSKSQEHRNIVADALLEIVSSWPKSLIQQHIRQIEQALTSLVNDAGLESRNSAKSAFDVLLSKNMIKSIPQFVISAQKNKNTEQKKQYAQPTRQKWSSSPQKKARRTGFEENSKTMTFQIRNSSNLFDISNRNNSFDNNKSDDSKPSIMKQKSKEQEIIFNVRKYKINQQSLHDNASYIAEGLVSCLDSTNDEDISSSLRLIDDVIGVLCVHFQKYLESLLSHILEFATSPKFIIAQNARHLLTSIPSYFDGLLLLRVVFPLQPNNYLLVFFQNVIRKGQSVLKDSSVCDNLLRICCEINETNNEARYKAITLTIIENIKKINNDAFTSFVSSATEQQINVLRKLSVLPSDISTPRSTTQTRLSTQSDIATPKSETQTKIYGFDTPRSETQTRLSVQSDFESPRVSFSANIETDKYQPVKASTIFSGSRFSSNVKNSSSRKFAFGDEVENTMPIPMSILINRSNKSSVATSKDDMSIQSVNKKPERSVQIKSVSIMKPVEISDIIKKIKQTDDKLGPIQELKDYFQQENDFSKDSLDVLISLIHSEYYLEVEECIDVLTKECEQDMVVSESLSAFLFYPSSSSIDFLTCVLKKVENYRYTPKVKNAMIQLRDHCVSNDPELRKSAIMCMVELKITIGEQVDADISTLEETQRILIQHYLEKRGYQ